MFGIGKRKITNISNKDLFIATLTRIVEILRDSGFTAQADAVRKPLECLVIDDVDHFVQSLMTVDIWGGSGAAWEVAPFPDRKTEIEFEECFIKLVELMTENGIKSSKARSISRFFKSDLKE